MTIPFWCLVVVIFIPFVLAGVGGKFRGDAFGVLEHDARIDAKPGLELQLAASAGGRVVVRGADSVHLGGGPGVRPI